MKINTVSSTHNSCYIKKAGFDFPIVIYGKNNFEKAIEVLSKNSILGEPARSYHFSTLGGGFFVRKLFVKNDVSSRKWYAGTRSWSSSIHSKNTYEFWAVFKKESDRTLALMLIQ